MRRQESREISLTYSSRPTEQREQRRRQRGEWTKTAEQGHPGEQQRWTNPSPERDGLEQAIRSTITHLNNLPMHKPSSPILTEPTTQQWLDHTFRLLVSVLGERSTVRGLKDVLVKGARMWDDGVKSQDMCDAMVGVKECLLVLGNLRESTSGVGDSSTALILFGHSGEYASAGNRSGSKCRRQTTEMMDPGSESGQKDGGSCSTLPWTRPLKRSSWKGTP